MKIPIEEIIKSISDQLRSLQQDIKKRYSIGDTSIAWIAELHIQQLLNIVFEAEYKLYNLNYKKPNYPSVDLADSINGIAWQITITNDKKGVKNKINHTLETFFKNRYKDEYPDLRNINKLHLFIATGIPPELTDNDIPLNVNTEKGQIDIDKSLFNYKHIWDFDKLIDKILQIDNTITLTKIEQAITGIINRPHQYPYSFNLDFIPRTISSSIEYRKDFTLECFNDKTKHIAILANAGEGKTTFIDHLANQLALDENVLCIKVRLIAYVNSLTELINTECKNWKYCYKSIKLVIIFDGLDEVDNSQFDKVYKEINNFIKSNPNINVITSCRTNFFPLEVNDDHNNDFPSKIYFLDRISEDNRVDFIRYKLGADTEVFLSTLTNSGLKTLIETPFFLVELLTLYLSDKILPESRVDFLQKLVKRQFLYENQKVGTIKSFIKNNKAKIDNEFKKLAFFMQYSGVNKLKDEELQELIPETLLLDSLKRILLEPINETCDTWRFKHNNFMEYYAALCLKEVDWNTLKSTILIPRHHKLRPRWLNTVSFYFTLADEDDLSFKELSEWLIRHDNSSLVKFEADKIPCSAKTSVLQKLIDKHKGDNLRIWGDGYTINDLARFIDINNNNNALELLLSYLKPDDICEDLKIDIIEIVNTRDNISPYKTTITDLYSSLYPVFYKTSIGSRIIEGLHKWKIYNSNITNNLTKNTLDLKAVSSLSILIDYLGDVKKYTLSATFLINTLDAVLNENSLGTVYYYPKLIKQVKSATLFNEFLLKLMEFKNERSEYKIWDKEENWKDLFSVINEKAFELFENEKDYQNTYINLINYLGSKLSYFSKDLSQILHLKPYLIRLNDNDNLFELHLREAANSNEWDKSHFCIPAMLYEPERITSVFDLYDSKGIDDWKIYRFGNALRSFDQDMYDQFYSSLNVRYNNAFVPKPDPWKVQRKEKRKLKLELLLDKQRFITYLKQVFNDFHDPITYDAIHQMEYYDYERPIAPHLEIILNLLRDFIKKDSSEKKDHILSTIEKEENWKWYQLNYYFNCAINSSKNKIPKENLDWIITWCNETEKNVNFDNPITWHENQSYSINNLFQYYVVLTIFTRIPPTSTLNCNKLVRFIGYFNEFALRNNREEKHSLSMFLINELGDISFNEQLLANFKAGIYDSISLQEYIKYLEDHSEIIDIDALLPYLTTSKVEYYLRNRVFKLYINQGGIYNQDILGYLNLIQLNNQIDWEVVDFITQSNPSAVTQWLKNKMMELEMDINHVTIRLLPYEPEEALSMYLEEFKKRQTALSDRFHENGNFLEQLKVKEINPSLLYDFLCELLIISVGKKFKNNDRSNFIPSIFNRFFDLFKEGLIDDLILKIEELLTSVKKDGQNEENKKNIIYWHKDFTKKCHIELDKKVSFRRAHRDLKQLLPELYTTKSL
ncbi:SMEK domain-containing protein [Plebeiibacterium marinum]|uniref:SMEK domain-containing protein n=1 Tax=Plebeiibacterium marinum TaxID=2992111 RepID=A0AAE3SLD3_9BACT|nr:SMEK domain-containing protein [Plebeiobacterium marinum]MCW3807770.1 SMEK domain-containing protein [Plebeiobacterium marinum]